MDSLSAKPAAFRWLAILPASSVQLPLDNAVLVSTISLNRARNFSCPGVRGWASAGPATAVASSNETRARSMEFS